VGTNKFDAAETVQSFLADELTPEKPGIVPPLPRGALTREQMDKIELSEKMRKERFSSLEEMLKSLKN
jgi:hypothetical protein